MTFSLVVLLLAAEVAISVPMGSDCSDEFTLQPPTGLSCDPLGTLITLQCATGLQSHNVTWYRTQNVSEAGVSGTATLNGGVYIVHSFGSHIKHLTFGVTESTLGYYWCEISNAVNVSLRSSTITPVCLPVHTSAKCSEMSVLALHHSDTECAIVNSPTGFPRPLLPQLCFSRKLPMTIPFTSTTIVAQSTKAHISETPSVLATVGTRSLSPTYVSTVTATQKLLITADLSMAPSVVLTTLETMMPQPSPNPALPLSWILVSVFGSLLLMVTFVLLVIIMIIFVLKRRTKRFTSQATVVPSQAGHSVLQAINPMSTASTLPHSSNGEIDVEMSQNVAYAVLPVFQHKPVTNEPSYEPVFQHKPVMNEPSYEPVFQHKPVMNEPSYEPVFQHKPVMNEPSYEPVC